MVGLEATTLPRGWGRPRTDLLAQTLRARWGRRGQGDGSLTSLPRLGDGGRAFAFWRLWLWLSGRWQCDGATAFPWLRNSWWAFMVWLGLELGLRLLRLWLYLRWN